MRVPAALLAAVAAGTLLVGCDPIDEQVDELAGLREEAAAGIEALDRFCTERDSVVVRAERGVPGYDRLLEEVLRSPVVIEDYCNEFRYHPDHEESDPQSSADSSGSGAR